MSQGDKAPESRKSLPPSEIGTLLANRYEVVRELGRGGMGVVYLCKDIVTQRARRAEAPAHAGRSEGLAARRRRAGGSTRRRARSRRSITPRSCARAISARSPTARPYLVMDALPGRSVHEWMHTTTMPWSVIWAIVDQVLAGLAHAHARGVIHGDLKPSNVMLDLASTGRGPRAYVLDLGLAWLRQSRHDPRLDGVARAGARDALGRRHRRLGRARADPQGRAARRPADGSLRARLHHVPRPHRQRGVRGERAGGAPRAQADAGAAAQLADGVPAGVGAVRRSGSSRRSPGTGSSSPPTRGARGRSSARRTRRRSRRRWRATPVRCRPAPSSTPGDGARGRRGALARAGAPLAAPVADGRARRASDASSWTSVDAGLRGQRAAAADGRAHRRSRRRQEPPRASGSASRCTRRGRMWPLRARYGRIPIAARRRHRRGEHTSSASRGPTARSSSRRSSNRWEVGKEDDEALTWVAATAEWLRPTPPGTVAPLGPTGKRFVLDTPELRCVVVAQDPRAHRARSAGLDLVRRSAPRERRTPSRCSRASAATRPKLRLLHRRDGAQRGARDRSRRRAPHGVDSAPTGTGGSSS